MSTIFALFSFLLGTIVGSFLNVLVLRLSTGEGVGGRSHCMVCAKTLGVFELIPVLSFIFLRGRCSACSTRISIQYPAVEFLTGIMFLLMYFSIEDSFSVISLTAISHLLFGFLVSAIFVAILVYDIRHKIIPPQFVLPLIGLSFISALFRFFEDYSGTLSSSIILNMAAGPIFYIFFYSLWKISKGRWLGLGDGNLVLAIGFFLGFYPGLSSLMLSFWIGALVGILLIGLSKVLPALSLKWRGRAVTMKSEIPFAPFLILGAALVYFFHIDVFSLF